MPRIIREVEDQPRLKFPDLLMELTNELKSDRRFGQPIIEEEHFPKTDAVRVTVIWDKWEIVPDEDRVATILQAYDVVENLVFRNRIALAIGVTVPEACESGLLPVQLTMALRDGDAVTLEQCYRAMLEAGASVLSDPKRPQLRFASVEQAEECRRRLIEQLPGSKPVWVISQDVSTTTTTSSSAHWCG